MHETAWPVPLCANLHDPPQSEGRGMGDEDFAAEANALDSAVQRELQLLSAQPHVGPGS